MRTLVGALKRAPHARVKTGRVEEALERPKVAQPNAA